MKSINFLKIASRLTSSGPDSLIQAKEKLKNWLKQNKIQAAVGIGAGLYGQKVLTVRIEEEVPRIPKKVGNFEVQVLVTGPIRAFK